MATYDTYKPFVIGNQFVPLVEQDTVIDIGSEIGHRFIATETSAGNNGCAWLRVVTTSPPPGVANRAEIVCRLYSQDPIVTCTPLKKLIVPCTAGVGGTREGGAPSREEAVQNPSDPWWVSLTGPSAKLKLWFGTSTAEIAAKLSAWSVEIVDVSVLYAVTGPFDTATTNTMSCGLERAVVSGQHYMDYLVTGPSSPSLITELKRSRFGELCPFWDIGTLPSVEPARGPWAYQGYDDVGLFALSGTGTDDVSVFFETGASAAGTFGVHYAALQITYRENSNLIGIGGMDLSGGAEIAEGLHTYRCPMMTPDYPWPYTGGVGVSAITLTKGQSYTLTVSRAYSGSVSVSSPVPIKLSLLNTIDQHVPGLVGVQITKPTAEGAIPTYSETTTYPAIVAFDISVWDWATDMVPANVNAGLHSYVKQLPQQVHDDINDYVEQQIPNDTAGTFAWATFYARAAEAVNGALYVSQTDGAGTFLGPSGSISYAEWLALPEIVDGWRRVTVAISPPAVLTGAGGVTYWRLWSSSLELLIWDVLGATANHTVTAAGASSGSVSGYHGQVAIALFTGTANYPLDMTITLAQEMTAVSGLGVTQEIQALTVIDEHCGLTVPNIPTGIVYNHLAWDVVLTAMVSGWGYYEIQRRDTTMDAGVWETIAKITTPHIGEMDDYEARIGVTSSYRIRTVHITGIEGPWSAEVTSTIVAPGVTGTGVDVGLLVFTSNEDPAANLAYIHIHDDATEKFDFIESGYVSLEPTYNRDYQTALWPTERGGVTFTRIMLVNKAGIPTETLDRGFTSLRDLAWDAIPYVCTRDELSNRWLANVNVPSGSTRRYNNRGTHYQIAQITVTEVTDTPYAHDTITPYLGLESTRNIRRYAEIESCAMLATVEDVDIRVKLIALRNGTVWGFSVSRFDVGPPESQWSFDVNVFDGVTTGFHVFGDDGTFNEEITTIEPIYGQPTWIRVVYDHDDGLGGSTATFYSSVDGVTWLNYGTITGGPAGLVPSANPFLVISLWNATVVQEMIMIDTATATTLMSPDFAAQTATTTSFQDAQLNTWNIQVY